MNSMARRQSTLGFEQTLMYGQYTEDLAEFARSHAQRINRTSKRRQAFSRPFFSSKLSACCSVVWRYTFAKIGEDWLFLALVGISMAILSFCMDFCISTCQKSRMMFYNEIGDNLLSKYFAWSSLPFLLILASAGFSQIVSPQAVGSGIPEMKTILRGVVLHEYLSFRAMIAKIVGLTCTLGSALPLGKEGPFVHLASIVATLLAKLVTSFKGIYDNESRTSEMLAAACAVGVAATFNAPIGGVLFSIEVTSVFFAVRNYWRGFFAACCGATVWRLFVVWFKNEGTAITALFKTHFPADFPFDPQELVIFALLGVLCGLGGAVYVKTHRKIVHFFRNHKRLNACLQANRFIYPGLVTLILVTVSFPPFLGQYMASTLGNYDTFMDLFSNVTWTGTSNDSVRLKIVKRWSTEHTSHHVNLAIYVFMHAWMSLMALTIPVPSGGFTPAFKIGAAFGRLVGELMVLIFPLGVSFGGRTNLIVPGGYSVVGAAAFTGAVTGTISTTVIAFELTGQMTHIMPVIIATLIANAVSQTLDLSIFDSIIQIKKLPFLPPIKTTSSLAHNIYVEDIMVRDIVFIWRNCTYRDIKQLLSENPNLQSFPLVDSGANMILLGSIQRDQLSWLAKSRLSRERRLQEVRRRYSTQDGLGIPKLDLAKLELLSEESQQQRENDDDISLPPASPPPIISTDRKMSRFSVTLVQQPSELKAAPPKPIPTAPKSILKHTISVTYSPNSTINNLSVQGDSRLRQAFENIFLKSLKLEAANPDKRKVPPSPQSINRRVQLPRKRVIDMSAEEQLAWEEEQLNSMVDFNECTINPAPFQLVERTSLLKVHSVFSMLGLDHAYVTSIGRLVGVVALKDLRIGIEKMNAGLLVPRYSEDSNYLDELEADPLYEDTLNSLATMDSEFTRHSHIN